MWSVVSYTGRISLTLLAATQISASAASIAEYVIHVSVDGLRPDAITALGPANAPNFYRLKAEGASTDNARSDYDLTITLPNHTTQLTGRGVLGEAGHGWTTNVDPAPGVTLASNKGAYIAGVFDVAHDHGLRTGGYVSKTKFSLFATSWNGQHGAPDRTGIDNGQNKIDMFVIDEDTEALVNRLVADQSTQPMNYVFLHLGDPDFWGHITGWDPTPGSAYSDAVRDMDRRLGTLLNLVTTNPRLAGKTALVVTADHGGSGLDHSDATLPEDYTIPFYVWGPGVMAGSPLYLLNPANRSIPWMSRPPYSDPIQPIRNGEAGNVALKLLGLPAIPGSTIGNAQDLALTVEVPDDLCRLTIGDAPALVFSTKPYVLYDVQARNNFLAGEWTDVATNIVGTGGVVTNFDFAATGVQQRCYRVRLHF